MALDSLSETVLKEGVFTCYHRIKELTKEEYVAVGDGGNILRWAPTEGPEQKWLIFPIDEDGHCNIFTIKNNECMAVGDNGNILRWAKTGGPEQDFRFVNKRHDGTYNIQERTKNEYVTVGSHGNILRWAPTGGDEQRFRIEPIDVVTPGKYPNFNETGDPLPQTPVYPEVKEIKGSLPDQSPKVLIGSDRLASVLVNNPDYTDKVLQVKEHPYYYLVRRQYWENIYDKKLIQGVEDHAETTVRVGASVTHTKEIETTIGVVVGVTGTEERGTVPPAKTGGPSKKVSLKLSAQLSWQRRELSKTVRQEGGYIEKKKGYTVSQKSECRVVAWQLVDEYSLYSPPETEKDKPRLLYTWPVYNEEHIDWTTFPKQS